jgi:uncharacterized membrane protein
MTMAVTNAAYLTRAYDSRSIVHKAILAVAAVAVLAGIFFRYYHLDTKTFWGDELVGLIHTLGYTEAQIVSAGPRIRAARDVQAYFGLSGPRNEGPRPLSATVRSLASEDPQHPPVFYVMQRMWAAWGGVTPAALRTLPLIFGLLSIGAMAWLALELFRNSRAALIAASLYAISPFAVLYAQEARETTLWALETLVASALLLRAARTASVRSWVAYGITCAISLYTYPLAAVVMVAHCATVASSAQLRKRAVLVPYFLASAAATLAFIPWLFVLATTQSGVKALGALLANDPSALGVVMTFMRDIKASLIDVGSIAPGSPARLVVSVTGTALLALTLYSLARLSVVSPRQTANRLILALFIIPALPILLIHGGALIGQLRYLQPTFIATQLALTSLYCATLSKRREMAFGLAFALIVISGAASCFISAAADTWYHKAYQRSPQVAAIINKAEKPLVVGDVAVVNDRGTSRVLEIAYALKPDVAMRVNLHCEACLIDPPPAIDVFADAGQFSTVFVLGKLKRTLPPDLNAVRQIGIDINPGGSGPLEMFAQYPR